jgi:hypothetical protein
MRFDSLFVINLKGFFETFEVLTSYGFLAQIEMVE